MTNSRKHLTGREVEKLLAAAKGSRHEARDRCLLLLMFRHGLRVSEACTLKLDQVDVESRVLHVARMKKGLSTTHPLRTDELRVIKAWLAERSKMKPSCRAFFVSQHRKPLNRRTAWLTIRKYGESGCPCPPTRTCSAMLAASPWPTRGQTRDSFKTILATGTSGTP